MRTSLSKKIAGLLLSLVFVAYVGVCAYYYLYQDSLIFMNRFVPAKEHPELKKYNITYEYKGQKINGWQVVYNKNLPTVFYYGGNGERVNEAFVDYQKHYGSAINFVTFEYPGYGLSTGKPSEIGFIDHQTYATKRFMKENGISPSKTVFIGRSMGSSVATQLAEPLSPAGVILITPFDSIYEIGHRRYPFLPLNMLLKYPFDSKAVAPRLGMPVLVVEAENDTVTPIAHAESLIEAWKGPVRKVFLKEGTHANIYSYQALWTQMNDFIRRVTHS